MIRPTSSPDVNRIAMNVKNDTGIGPVQRTLPQRTAKISALKSATAIATVRISATSKLPI